MMKHGIKYTLISLILVVAILLSPVVPAIRLHQITISWQEMLVMPAQAQEAEENTIYLPLMITPPGPPAFEIINPSEGSTVSGMTYFAAQPTDPETVTNVTFKAGSTELGSDSDASDGFRAFLNVRDFPAGELQLSAIATGPSGETTKNVTVNVLPNPPSSGTVDSQGGVFGSEIGSIITIPPGSVPDGTNVTVTEMTQEEVTQENGFDWDAMGVTFLGAQKIESNADISKPLGVASAGFGPRVQPGQAVVNYRIAPDADGDGVDELIVVNSASFAPNGDVISDPVAQISLGSTATTFNSRGATTCNLNYALPETGIEHQTTNSNSVSKLVNIDTSHSSATMNDISGPPGTIIEIEAAGFNPASAFGNVAIFQSLVTEERLEIPSLVSLESENPSEQTFLTLIPPLPAGSATLRLYNKSTNSTIGPIEINIESSSPLSQPASEIIDDFFAQTISFLQTLPTPTSEAETRLSEVITQHTELGSRLQELSNDSTPDVQQFLTNFAIIIENSGILSEFASFRVDSTLHSDGCISERQQTILKYTTFLIGAVFGGLCLGLTGPFAAACGWGVATQIGAVTLMVGDIPICDKPQPSCDPSQSSSGSGTTGMGAAPPPGGNGCGNAAGGGDGSLRQQREGGLEAGRFVIKVFSNGSRTPFSGMTDAGGYFFVPFIPEGEPFSALAIDTVTGQTRSFAGTGPVTGESTFMFFDFFSEDDGSIPIQISQVISGEISVPGEADVYSFSASAGQAIYFDEQGASGNMSWRLLDPDGNKLFNQTLSDSDAGTYTLSETGTYNIFVQSTAEGTASYQFQLWDATPDEFSIAIGDIVSDGNPGAGAGNIETPGKLDIYTFQATAGQVVFFDLQEGFNNEWRWELVDAEGTVVFDQNFGDDPGSEVLELGGTYTMTIGNPNRDHTGTYQFEIIALRR